MLGAGRDRLVQGVDSAQIGRHRRRVQGDNARRFVRGGQFAAKPVAHHLQRRQFALKLILLDQSLHIGAIHALMFALGCRQFAFDAGALVDLVGGQALALLVVDTQIERDRVPMAQLLAQAHDDVGLDAVEIIGAAVAATVGLGRLRATYPDPTVIAILDRHARVAGAAAQQTGKQMPRRDALARRHLSPPAATLLDRRIEIGRDDRQLRRLAGLVLVCRIDSGDALACRRILDHPDPVPDRSSGIERIDEDAVATLAVAIDRGCRPEAPARRQDAFLIEAASDDAGASPFGILSENAPDGFGLRIDDLQFADPAGNRPVAISSAAGIAPFPDDAGHAAADFLGQPFEEQRRHRALDADMHLGDLAVGDGDDLDAGEGQRLEEPCDVGEIARQAVEILGDDQIEFAGERQSDQALIVRPTMDRGAGRGMIGISARKSPSGLADIGLAQRELIIDRAIILQVG
nr:hypothetical protein [Bosea lathyri]